MRTIQDRSLAANSAKGYISARRGRIRSICVRTQAQTAHTPETVPRKIQREKKTKVSINYKGDTISYSQFMH